MAPLQLPGTHYTDRQWAGAVKWRLGIPEPGPVNTCMNMNTNGEPCNAVLDAQGDHAVQCGTGPLRTFRHDDLSDIYAEIFEEVGAVARREVFVPEFLGREEAWLDVWAYGISELPDALLDITVRHPRAERYQPGAANCWGYTAARAEEEKTEK